MGQPTEPEEHSFEPDERQRQLTEEAVRRSNSANRIGHPVPDELLRRMQVEQAAESYASPRGTPAAPPSSGHSQASVSRDPSDGTMGSDESKQRPLLFLDVDDVLALNTHYGGREARKAIFRPEQAPTDLYEKLFSRDAVDALNALLLEFNPRVVMTTSWLMLLNREEFLNLFKETGVNIDDSGFHQHWDAPENYGEGRANRIGKWLADHHAGENLLILDDVCSGATLVDSPWHRAGHVVLCEENVGFHGGLLDAARKAMLTPFLQTTRWKPWDLMR